MTKLKPMTIFIKLRLVFDSFQGVIINVFGFYDYSLTKIYLKQFPTFQTL